MRWARLMRTLHIFSPYWSCAGQRANVVHSITVAILAQGTSWAVAATQAFLGLGSSPQVSVRTLPAHTQAIFATPWTLARPRLWDRSPTGRLPSDHIHIHVGPASSSPPSHMPKGFLPMSGMPSESMGFLSSAGYSVRLLTSRSGVRASQGAFGFSFGTLCATIQIATTRCKHLHPFRKVYVRTPLGFDSTSINSRTFCKGYPRGISLDFCGLVSPSRLHWISMGWSLFCKGCPFGTSSDFCDSWRVKNMSGCSARGSRWQWD
jgi:hypothetical protein